MALIDYTPAYVNTTEQQVMKAVITPEHWNEMFNLLTAQGNNNSTALLNILLALDDSTTAAQLGVAAITGVAGTNVQAIMASLKGLIDLCYTASATDTLLAQRESVTAANALVKTVSFTPADGKFTFTTQGGTTTVIDTAMEKMAVNFAYNATTQALDLTLEDGSTTSVPLNAFITETEFLDSAQIDFSVTNHQVTATIKAGSVTSAMLEGTLLTAIIGYRDAAAASATAAATSAANALTHKNNAATSASNAATSEANALTYKGNALTSANAAAASATAANTAKVGAETAQGGAVSAQSAAATARTGAETAKTAAEAARDGAVSNAQAQVTAATQQATNAGNSATLSAAKSVLAQSYTTGGTGTRTGEDTDNAKYYKEQAAANAGVLARVATGFAVVNGSTRPTLGENAVDLSYANDNTKGATGVKSFAEGYNTTADGLAAHAEGQSTTASGDYSHAEGAETTAGRYAHAEGYHTSAMVYGLSVACSDASITLYATNEYTVVFAAVLPMGILIGTPVSFETNDDTPIFKGTVSNIDGLSVRIHCETTEITSPGSMYTFTILNQLSANAESCGHAEGKETRVYGIAAHAEGEGTTASGKCSHAEGAHTTALGAWSHAEGTETKTSGDNAHTEGKYTAAGDGAHAEGINSIACAADGIYNIVAADNTARTLTLNNVSGLSIGAPIKLITAFPQPQ